MKTARLFSILTIMTGLTSLPLMAQGGAKENKPLGRSANAFDIKAKLDRPEALPSPQFSTAGINKKFSPKDWFSMEVEVSKIEVKDAARTALGIAKDAQFISPVRVSFYMHVKSIEDPKKWIQLEKTVTYLNVPLNEPTYFSVYLSPSTIKRLFKADKFNPSNIERVGFEITYKDEIIYRSTKPFGGYMDWWNLSSANVLRDANSYPLLSKDETPFAPFWWDRYPEVKPKSGKDDDSSSTSSLSTPPPPPVLGGEEPAAAPGATATDGKAPRKSRAQQRREESETGFKAPDNN